MAQCIESGEVIVKVGEIKESLFKLIKYYDSLDVSKKSSAFDNNVREPTRKLLNRRYEMKVKIFFKIDFGSAQNLSSQISRKENNFIISMKPIEFEMKSPCFQIDFRWFNTNSHIATWPGEYVDINIFFELVKKLSVQFTL